MSQISVKPLKGTVTIPGDKSISHRAVMFGSLAEGTTEITHFLKGADCLSTIACFRQMGISIEEKKDCILVHGKGLHGLSAPSSMLDTGNSGTTTRLISGILSGQPFESVLNGDASIQKASHGTDHYPSFPDGCQYHQLKGKWLCSIKNRPRLLKRHPLPVTGRSAQVKSASSGRSLC